MTFDRFYSIIKPHKATVTRAKITTICILILSISYNIPHLFTSSDFGRQCMSHVNAATDIYVTVYFWSWICLAFVVPFILLLSMNSVIIHTLRKRSFNTLISKNHGPDQSSNESNKAKQSEKQIYTMLLLVSFTFLVLYTPVNVLVLYINFFTGSTPSFFAGQHLFFHVSEKLFYTSHGINFFLYVLSGQKFRADLVKLFHTPQFK